MKLSLLQLNINSDNFWNTLIQFLTSHDFDILHLQELTGKETFSGNIKNAQRDCYEELQKILGSKYDSEIAITHRYTSNPKSSYLANATFYKKEFQLIKKNIVTLYKRETPFPSDSLDFTTAGRNLLHLILQINGKKISFINGHLAWAKTTIEQPHQTEQGKIILDYIQTVDSPFIFSGDFNIDTHQPLIKKIEKFARNVATEHHVITTLNPRTHQARVLFPPGAAVDYIFTSNDLVVKNFAVIEEDLSDHFGLTVDVSI